MSDDLLPPDPTARAALIAEAHRLLDLLPDSAEAETAGERCSALFGSAGEDAPELETARAALARSLSRYPLGGLLLHRPDGRTANAVSLDFLRAWTLAAVLDAVARGEAAHTAWRFGARIVRQLCTDEAWREPRLRLPDLRALTLSGLRLQLGAWIAAETALDLSRGTQLEHVRRALEHLAGVPRRRQTPATRKRTDKSRRHAAGAACRVALRPGSGTAVAIDCADHDHEGDPLMSVEEAADVAGRRSIRSMHHDLGEVIEDLEEADPSSSSMLCSRNLSQPESQQLARDALEAIGIGAAPGVAMLAASLLLGETIAVLAALPRVMPETTGIPWWHDGAEGIGLAFAPPVTKAPKPPHGAFEILLPEPVASAVRAALASGLTVAELEDQARAFLARRPGRSQRLTRIAQCLPAAIAADGTDAGIAGFLCRADIRSTPQMYYTCVQAKVLQDAWRDFGVGWLGLARETLQLRPLSARHPLIGSRLVPEDRTVASFFGQLRGNLDAAAEKMSRGEPGAVRSYHAAFVAAQAGLLACTTASRPHLEACPPFSQLQLAGPHPAIRWRDKNNRQVDDARWLPVCPTQLEAFVQLRRHLADLRAWAVPTSPELVRHIDRALAGEISPLFSIAAHQDAPPEPLRWAEYWATHCPQRQVRNMFRHFWRSRFTTLKLPGWQIDYHMGHGGWHGAQYLPLGAYRAADLAPLRETMEAGIRSLDVTIPKARRLPE